MSTTLIRLNTKKVNEKIIAELDAVIANHRLASHVITSVNTQEAHYVLEGDKEIDHLYLDIESDLEFLISKAPTDKDLRRTLAYLAITKEVERIGDYAKHIAKFVLKQEGKIAASSISRITSVHNLFFTMLNKLREIVVKEDAIGALALAKMDIKVDELVLATRTKIIESISRKRLVSDVKERVFVLNVVNSLERAADHIVGVCEMVVYINDGKHGNLLD